MGHLISPRFPLDRQESRRLHFSNGRNYFKTRYARPVLVRPLDKGACFGLRRVYALRANLRVQPVFFAEVHAKYLLAQDSFVVRLVGSPKKRRAIRPDQAAVLDGLTEPCGIPLSTAFTVPTNWSAEVGFKTIASMPK